MNDNKFVASISTTLSGSIGLELDLHIHVTFGHDFV